MNLIDILNDKSRDQFQTELEQLPSDRRTITGIVAKPLTGYIFTGCKFSEVKFSNELHGTKFTECTFIKVHFNALCRTAFSDCTMDEVTFNGDLQDVLFTASGMASYSRISTHTRIWDKVILDHISMSNSNLHNTELRNTIITDCTIISCSMSGTKFKVDSRDNAGEVSATLGFNITTLSCCDLTTTSFLGIHFRQTHFEYCLTRESTLIQDCTIDRRCYSIATPLRVARVPTEFLSALTRNNRERSIREQILKSHGWSKVWLLCVNQLWRSTDYGTSGRRLLRLTFATFLGGLCSVMLLTVLGVTRFHGLYLDEYTPKSIWNFLIASTYYVVVTLTTVGYGDMYPEDWIARLIAVSIMIAGYFIFAALASRLSSILQD